MQDHSLEGLLRYYRDQVTDGLALAYSVADKIPVAILNEIRNAFSHLSRVADFKDGSSEREKELYAAYNHLLRVRLDCAKLCLIVQCEKFDEDLEALTHLTTAPRSVMEEAEALRKRRQEVQGREAIQVSDDLVDDFLVLFGACSDFGNKLRTEYGDVVVEGWRKQQQDKLDQKFSDGVRSGRKATLFAAVVIGLVTSIVGGAIIAAIL